MDKPLISVIVPVYMIDRYVGLCIESIINQTYRNLEIILVDDGGKDRCPEICDLYARKDSRIKVVHKSNGGLVSARKAGLRESNGTYISYVDGDDWIGPGFIDALYTAARTCDADMVCTGFTRDLFTKSASFLNCISSGIYEGAGLNELWRSMISHGSYYRPGISTYVWNKLFRREIVQEAQNNVDNRISIGEDGAVTYPALLKCKRVAVTDHVAYHYRQREDSMLKQNAGYAAEARKLRVLYDYMIRWAETTPEELDIRNQVIDYVLSMAIIRSGGRLPRDDFSTFDNRYFGKKVVIFSAGTFGQQLVTRFRETRHCDVISWIDDDYWEYRRCCLDVDPVEKITEVPFDYVLIATVDNLVAERVKKRLLDLGVGRSKLLAITVPRDREELVERFLDVRDAREETRNEGISHA